MKNSILPALFFCCAFSLHAQEDYGKIDTFALSFKEPYTDAADLARQLTKHYSTDREKARVIFAWIAYNIRYDYQKYKSPTPPPQISASTPQEFAKNMKTLQEKEIRTTLLIKRGVCADYSRLFQKMCESAGLESVTVTGTSSTRLDRNGKHAWNAVKFDGSWHLMDATWGAGFVETEDERFVRRFTPAFFATPPSLFILNHFPADEKWQMLDKPLSKREFNKLPIVNFSNRDFPIEAFFPENGKIVPTGGKAEIRLKFGKKPGAFIVSTGKSREIPAQVDASDDGWVTLTFSPGNATEITVYAGKHRNKTTMILQFSVD
jgi:hypothetical protein